MHCGLVDLCIGSACEGRSWLWLWLWLARLFAPGLMTLPTWQHIMATLSILYIVQGAMSKQMRVIACSDLANTLSIFFFTSYIKIKSSDTVNRAAALEEERDPWFKSWSYQCGVCMFLSCLYEFSLAIPKWHSKASEWEPVQDIFPAFVWYVKDHIANSVGKKVEKLCRNECCRGLLN